MHIVQPSDCTCYRPPPRPIRGVGSGHPVRRLTGWPVGRLLGWLASPSLRSWLELWQTYCQ
eukprot:8116338-Alexandrium_andersonii.AAC.1